MASASTLRRTRQGFLVVAILAFLVAGGLFLFTARPGHPPDRVVKVEPPPPPVAVQHPGGHGDTQAQPPKAIEPVPPAAAAGPAPAALSSLSAFASLSTAVIALLGFVITSVMTVRRERRDSALFAIDLEMKRAQLAEMQSKAAQAGKVAAG